MKQKLEKKLKELEKVVISYSGGIDSSFLVKFAKEILGKEKSPCNYCKWRNDTKKGL